MLNYCHFIYLIYFFISLFFCIVLTHVFFFFQDKKVLLFLCDLFRFFWQWTATRGALLDTLTPFSAFPFHTTCQACAAQYVW